jgi:PBSX family phage terminase large subunit
MIKLLRDGPKGDVLIVGVTRDSIQRNILNDLFRLLGTAPPPSKNSEAKVLGRQLYFIGASDESAVRRIQGATSSLAYVDEATCIPPTFWRMLLSRLSVQNAQLLATCNPEGPLHWLKKDFLDHQDTLNLKTWRFVLDDNPALGEDYKRDLKNEYTGVWYSRFIDGNWCVAQGVVFDGFDPLENVFHDDYPPPDYYVAGVDYGTTNPTSCHIAAISPTRYPQIRIEDEYYFDSSKAMRGKTDAELVDDLKRFIGWRSIRAIYVDPAAASLKLEMRAQDLPVLDANNDVLFGIKQMNKYLAGRNLVVRSSCKHLIEQLQSYSWDEKAAQRGEDKPIKIADHATDSCRYLCASAFPHGLFSSPDENLTIEQLKRKVYGDNLMADFQTGAGGYL